MLKPMKAGTTIPRVAALLCAALLAAACSGETALAPASALQAPEQPAAAVFTNTLIDFKKLYPKLTVQIPSVTMRGDTTVQKFTVNPLDGKLIVFGKNSGNVVAIPANTICDPKLTLYGPATWLLPCTLAKSSVSFEVRSWTDATGTPHADFYPDVRFSPSAPVPVRLYLQVPATFNYADAYIPYCNALNVCVNEELLDPELTSYVSPVKDVGYWVYRTLRHFSGYVVAERGDGSGDGLQ
jgi:hypothetical protein